MVGLIRTSSVTRAEEGWVQGVEGYVYFGQEEDRVDVLRARQRYEKWIASLWV